MNKPFLGVVHLRALPCSPRHESMASVLEAAMVDAQALRDGGVDGIVVENFGDVPFRKGDASDPVTPDVPAALALVGWRIRTELGLPVAMNCLRNDARAALGAAAVCSASWVRVNVWSGAYCTDQGVIEGEAAAALAFRKQLGCTARVWADLLVKHAKPLVELDPAEAALDLAERSGADGIVVTGTRTGAPVDATLLATVKDAVGNFPVILGSGLNPSTAPALWPRCDGAIVGTWLKRDGILHHPVDADRVRQLRRELERLR